MESSLETVRARAARRFETVERPAGVANAAAAGDESQERRPWFKRRAAVIAAAVALVVGSGMGGAGVRARAGA